MREAGAPSTVGVVLVSRRCARHPGGSHALTTGDSAQRTTGNVQAALNSPGKRTKKRGQGQYKGRSP
jgi:hypothetical protein